MYKDIETVLFANSADNTTVVRLTKVGKLVMVDCYDEVAGASVPCEEFEFDAEELELMLMMVK